VLARFEIDVAERPRPHDGVPLQSILDQLPAGTLLVRPDGITAEFVSASARRVLGGDGTVSALTDTALSMRTLEGLDIAPADRPVARALTGEVIEFFECELARPDGQLRILRVNATPMRDASGALAGALIAFVEITSERLAIEQSRRDADFRDIFLAMLGHDLRNPLAAILTSARLAIRRGALPAGEQKTIARIVSSGERMERMIDQILDMTRARQSGGIPLRCEPKDVAGCVTKAVEAALAERPDARVALELAEGNFVALIDSDRIEQVVAKLVGNAIVHGTAGLPVRVAVRADGASVTVSIHNHGAAITPERQRTLFDPFTRGHSPKEARSSGLGLGLYIAEHIVRAHGGAIALDSSNADGVTFSFTLAQLAEAPSA